jgi:hypothetical protein
MRNITFGRLLASLLFTLAPTVALNAQSLRATISGSSRDGGTCTVQVNVDGAAEVEIHGDAGFLRTVSGRPAAWRRFQCSAPLPNAPSDLRMSRIEGRGMVRIVEDPRRSGGRAVIRIEDPQSGSATYRFDLEWRAFPPSGWPPSLPPGRGGIVSPRVIQACKDAVAERLHRNGYDYLTFDRVSPGTSPGWMRSIDGLVTGKHGHANHRFSFSCNVDLSTGSVRSVDVRNR